MQTDLSPTNILECAAELFPQTTNISHAFIKYVQPEGLKTAYRDRIKENHPDKAIQTGMSEEVLAERFKKITKAYQCLIPYVNKQISISFQTSPVKNSPQPHKNGASKAPNKQKSNSANYWPGSIPTTHLRLGEFLYYSRCISWQELWASLKWQREKRPLIGALALEWKFMTHKELNCVLANQKQGEHFGKRAIEMGFLSDFQLLALLGRQAGFRQKIGEYFISKGILSSHELNSYVSQLRLHNLKTPH